MSHLVPFKILSLYADLAEAKGIARFDENILILEFQTKDTVFGIFKSKVREKRLHINELHSVRFQKKWLNSRLIINASTMNAFENIPGSEQGEIKLLIARKDRDIASQLALEIELAISDHKLKELEEQDLKRAILS